MRVPDNNIARAIVEELGNPLLSTSVATNHDEPEYTTHPELIAERYASQVDYIIDGGDGDIVGSTIIDCTEGEPVMVRQGKGEIID